MLDGTPDPGKGRDFDRRRAWHHAAVDTALLWLLRMAAVATILPAFFVTWYLGGSDGTAKNPVAPLFGLGVLVTAVWSAIAAFRTLGVDPTRAPADLRRATGADAGGVAVQRQRRGTPRTAREVCRRDAGAVWAAHPRRAPCYLVTPEGPTEAIREACPVRRREGTALQIHLTRVSAEASQLQQVSEHSFDLEERFGPNDSESIEKPPRRGILHILALGMV